MKTVVTALDFSKGSQNALVRAADISERLNAKLHILHVDIPSHTGVSATAFGLDADEGIRDRMRTSTCEALGLTESELGVLDPEFVVAHDLAVAPAVCSYAERVGARLLVIGTHGRRGMRRFFLGSTAEELVRSTACPVYTIPHEAAKTAPGPSAPVIAPVDFSDHNLRALRIAVDLARPYSADVVLVHVLPIAAPAPHFYPDYITPVPMIGPEIIARTEKELQKLAADAGIENSEVVVRMGSAAEEIAEVAKELGAGAIVMATAGLSGFKHMLLGSVAERTLRHAPCPVLTYRTGDEGEID